MNAPGTTRRGEHGAPARGGLHAVRARIRSLSVKKRLAALLAATVVVMLVRGAIGLAVLFQATGALNDTYEQGMLQNAKLARIIELMSHNQKQILLGLQHDPASVQAKSHDHPLADHTDAVVRNRDEIAALWSEYGKDVRSQSHESLADAYFSARMSYINEGLMPARQALIEGRYDEANAILLQKINPLFDRAKRHSDGLVKYNADRALEAHAKHAATVRWLTGLTVATVSALLIVVAWLAVLLIRGITRPLDGAA